MTIPVRRRLSHLVALFTLLASPRAAAAQDVPSDSAIRAIIRARVDSGRAPGIVVGVIEHGRRRYYAWGTGGPGVAPLDEHTAFEIGSITKTFTGLLLADAVVRGEVRLDEPLADLLPAGTVVPSRDGHVITLEQLSTHRSGLPRLPTNLSPADVQDPYVDYGARRLNAFLATYTLPRAPGDSAEYSNLGAGLLGYALASHAGMPSWDALVTRRVIDPLGLRETFIATPAAMRGRVAIGHDPSMAAVHPWNFDALAGASALRSTASDMLTYLDAALDTTRGPLRRAESLAAIPRADFAPGIRIALGWMVVGPATHPVWWHDGITAGFQTFAAFDPARQLGVVVLANANMPVADIGMHLMNPQVPVVMPMLPLAPGNAVTLAAEALDRLTGTYTLAPTMLLVVTREGDTLYGQATGQGRFPLTATAADRFVFPAAGIELTFDIAQPGPARALVLRQGGANINAPRRP